ncbi:hypothetical protein ACFFOP_10210 [Sinosporangium siamense]
MSTTVASTAMPSPARPILAVMAWNQPRHRAMAPSAKKAVYCGR